MKKILLFFSILVMLLIVSACSNEMTGQKVTIQKRVGEENIFEDFREVTQKDQVKKAMDIVTNANWENAKVEMERYADYQFQFPSSNYNSNDEKIASYLLWISPNGKNLEIVTDSNRYVRLTEEDSADLYEILMGEEL